MALTRILSRTFSTALKHTRVVHPVTINPDSKPCSKRLIGPLFRNFCTSPVVSDDMQMSATDQDLIHSVKSLHADVESLRTEVGLLSEVVHKIQNDKIVSRFGSCYSEETCDSDSDGNIEKVTEKTGDLSEASEDNKAAEKMNDFSEEIQKGDTAGNNDKATEKMSDFDTEGNNDKATEKMSDFDTEGNNDKATEKMSDFSAPQSDGEEGNYETVPDGKERDSLHKEIAVEIMRAVEFSCVCSQSRIFPDYFPFKVYNDIWGVPSVTFNQRNKSENIHVTVRPPSLFTSITAENYHYHKSCSFIMRLHVEIYPLISEGRSLVFDCSAYRTGYFIENVYGFDHRDTKGLDFSELNENLQKGFKKYLETRGITTSTTNGMFGYMLEKLNTEKLRCLYKFKELVEA